MIIVHDIFICKPGNASKVAKIFKDAMGNQEGTIRIMTDITGEYNKVVMVSQFENLTAYEKMMESYTQKSGEMKETTDKMAGYTDMYLTGSREIYKVW